MPDIDFIPGELYSPLRETLLACGPFKSNEQLISIFAHELLVPWQDQVPETTNREDRVDALINFLKDQYRTDIETNVLVLFLNVVRERKKPKDKCYKQLAEVARKLAAAFQDSTRPGSLRLFEEANPGDQPMLFTRDWVKLSESLKAVGKVNVPQILQGKVTGNYPSGTGWLVAPGLVLTCWHVIRARGNYDDAISNTDLNIQVTNTVLTFDYTAPGEGIGYSAAGLECYDSRLDYALLRLENRSDYPLSKRGYLGLDVEAPLNIQTSLYIIQHPRGQPQQSSTGRFEKRKVNQPERILHTAPSAQGTSGAPVVNEINWGVVALHDGEDPDEQLREATLLKAILLDIQQKRPDLYARIMDHS